MPDAQQPLHVETRVVTLGRPSSEPDQPLNVPVTLTSTFIAGGDLEYGRYGNPTWTAFEDVLGDLEGGRCIAFASGMAAIAAVLDLLDAGSKVVAPRHSYTGTIGQLQDSERRGRITVEYVDIADTEAVVGAAEGAALVWIETPTNPALEVADVAAIAAGAHAAGALVAVDNTFATPLLQRPLESGADLVVHSATKYISGHSDVLMGAVVTATAEHAEAITSIRTLRGAIPAPLETFLALRGLRTLPVRLERAQSTAQELVRRLSGLEGLQEVRYPGFGAIVSIVLPTAEAADALASSVRLWRHATSLGGVESTLERRRRWPAEASTIPEGLVRLSVGLEHVDDLERDLRSALGA
ncbi:PLP-dependent aspartate aminotransferase family protein [Amnibacterium sp. CER49]|uniref:trans-sulfuration enzyme family protein n=1 Tax=Amnibacterium sp. CER49 TaxID=3039161 RepID=UPI0024486CE2|nr:PLP-dependent aspartate aminotransferase family protein [Amnibacterium sp. CER49]MDH2444259.1 PLP-dependent aspartate aminotransferase family protein [Amnibacterium sp. CER49]